MALPSSSYYSLSSNVYYIDWTSGEKMTIKRMFLIAKLYNVEENVQ